MFFSNLKIVSMLFWADPKLNGIRDEWMRGLYKKIFEWICTSNNNVKLYLQQMNLLKKKHLHYYYFYIVFACFACCWLNQFMIICKFLNLDFLISISVCLCASGVNLCFLWASLFRLLLYWLWRATLRVDLLCAHNCTHTHTHTC